MDHDQAILKVMSLEGLRLKEAWLLEIRDADFDNGVINLRKEIVKGKHRPRLTPHYLRHTGITVGIRSGALDRDEARRMFGG